jgi:general secretion pathway protein C
MELLLLSLLSLQCARLVWTIVTPVGPVGDWKASSALRPVLPRSTGLGGFDPFFRLSGAGTAPVVVTALNLKLYGVREDRASGRGSAIISTPEGQQRSFAVGDEIVAGVTLTAVGFDNVTISRNGTVEQLFLDQSSPADMVSPQGGTTTPTTSMAPAPSPGLVLPPQPTPTVVAPPRPSSISSDIQFQPRINGGQMNGVVVQPQGSGDAFRAAGLAPGDVILSVNGQRITSADQARAIAGQVGSGDVAVQVERAGRTIPLRMRAGQ